MWKVREPVRGTAVASPSAYQGTGDVVGNAVDLQTWEVNSRGTAGPGAIKYLTAQASDIKEGASIGRPDRKRSDAGRSSSRVPTRRPCQCERKNEKFIGKHRRVSGVATSSSGRGRTAPPWMDIAIPSRDRRAARGVPLEKFCLRALLSNPYGSRWTNQLAAWLTSVANEAATLCISLHGAHGPNPSREPGVALESRRLSEVPPPLDDVARRLLHVTAESM